MNVMYFVLCIVLCALNSMHHISPHTSYSIYCIITYAMYFLHYIIFYSLYFVHCFFMILFYLLYSMHCIICVVFYWLYLLHYIQWVELNQESNVLLSWNWFWQPGWNSRYIYIYILKILWKENIWEACRLSNITK